MMTVEPSQRYLCVQYIPKKNFEIPGEGSVVGRRQAGGLLKECCEYWLALYYFGKNKLACSIAFELPPTHLRTAFSWRVEQFIFVPYVLFFLALP